MKSRLSVLRPAIAKQAQNLDNTQWWRDFEYEIEQLGGFVKGHPAYAEDLEISVPAEKMAEVREIVRRYAFAPGWKK